MNRIINIARGESACARCGHTQRLTDTAAVPERSGFMVPHCTATRSTKMAVKSETKLDWKTLDLATVDTQIAGAFAKAKEAYKIYQSYKAEAEQLVIDSVGLPATHTLRFGYRFGGVSIAVDLADAPKARKGAVSLGSIGAEFKPPQALIKKVA
jgi:hypothetical protein